MVSLTRCPQDINSHVTDINIDKHTDMKWTCGHVDMNVVLVAETSQLRSETSANIKKD